MISKDNHVKFARFVLLAHFYISTGVEIIISSSYCRDKNNNNKLYYQIEKLNLIYTHNVLIKKKVTFTQNGWKVNLAE